MTTEKAFKPGDVVVLKSGSPSMTIDKFVWNPERKEFYTDKVECVWFDNKELKKQEFQITSLEYK